MDVLAKKLEGLHTVSSIMKLLGISRRTAINYISMLRKAGLVKTTYSYGRTRMYAISPVKKPKLGYEGLYDVINKHSRMKIRGRSDYRIHAHKLSIEEAVVRAIRSGRSRLILASLGLFNKIKNWHRLYMYAKEEGVTRKVGALYDVAAITFRVRVMDKRTRKALLKGKMDSRYIIKYVKSEDFKEIERKWNVFIPFNKVDLEEYKE